MAGLSFFRNQTRGGTTQGTPKSQPPAWEPLVLQVFLNCRPLPGTVDARGLSSASWLCPLPLAPAESALLACPQGLDMYFCTMQPASLAQPHRDSERTLEARERLGCTLREEGGDSVSLVGTEPQALFQVLAWGSDCSCKTFPGSDLSQRSVLSWCP